MKLTQFIIFLSVVLSVYFAVNYYIFIRGLQAMPGGGNVRLYYKILFLLVVLAFPAGRFIERVMLNRFSDVIVWAGDIWLAAMLYFFLTIVLIDFVRLLNHFLHFLPSILFVNYEKTKLITFLTASGIVAVTLIGGFINAANPKMKELTLETGKKSRLKELNIAMASDIHLGNIISNGRVNMLVEKINALNPDIILFAGDIVDEDLAPVIKNNLGADLTQLKSKYGVYAITGNHEYIGGAEKAVRYCEEHGVKFLRDETVLIDSAFYLAGRDDRDKQRFSGKPRKKLDEILNGIDSSFPLIVMNHQPFNLDEAEKSGVDLHLSGHTHHGQLWPLNYITKAVYELSWGYMKKGNTHYYVSSGFGTWGPPMRTGNTPEIVNIRLKFR